MDSTIDDIKRKIDIVEYINALVPLKKMGRTYKACCPFHNEKTPSFTVSPDRQIWRCFGACQEGGDVISFLMKWENITFFEALKELAQLTGVTLETTKIEDRSWKDKELLLRINQMTSKYYQYLLTTHPSGKPARAYIKDRAVTDALSTTFQLGYAPESWDSLLKFLIKKGFREEDIERAGLALRSSKDPSRFYDRFRGRLMFPIIDARQNILGFSGRLLIKDEKQAKYVNSPETPIYRKRETLYGMHVAHEAIRKEKIAIIVEGEFDMISSYKHGIGNTVAIKGSAFTKDQLMLLKRYTQHLILALDADFSGTQTTLKAIKDAEDMDFRIDIIRYDFAKDPDEALAKDPVAYKKLIKKPIPIYDFILDTALSRHTQSGSADAYAKKEAVDDVLPFLHGITNSIIRSHYIKRLADAVGIDVRDVESSLRTFALKGRVSTPHTPPTQTIKIDRHEALQKHILAQVLQSDDPLPNIALLKEILEPNDFTIPSYAQICQALIAYQGQKFDISLFAHSFTPALHSVLDELFLHDISAEKEDSDPLHILKIFKKTLLELKKLSLKHILKDTVAQSQDEDHDSTSIHTMMEKLAQVEKELRIL